MIDNKQNEVKVTIRNQDSFVHINNYVDISNGIRASYGKLKDGKIAISAEGFDAMIFITMTEFPSFYEKHQLAMVWRN